MTEFKIDAKEREIQKNNALRKDGFIPGNIYGNNFNNLNIAFDKIAFSKLYKEAGHSNLIDVKVGDKSIKTLVHEVQVDPITNNIVHVDLFKVNMKEKIHAEVPLNFIGESPAVLNMEGILITNKDSIEVECLPSDLVSEIDVDISVLDDFEKNIKVEDLKIPTGIEILDDIEEVVVTVQEPRSEEELEALDTEVVENVEAIEVENKGEEAAAEGEAVEEKKSE